MALSFYNSYINNLAKAPSEQIREDYQIVIDNAFEIASTLRTIEQESDFSTNIWENIQARVTTIAIGDSGDKKNDDYRKLIFIDYTYTKPLGYRYKFENNIWLVINTSNIFTVTASVVAKRCNNFLRFIDENGYLQKEPCAIDYTYNETEFDWNTDIVLAEGDLTILAQDNNISKNVFIGQRFLFGGQAYKIKGIQNFLLQETLDDSTNTILRITMRKDAIDTEKDDIQNNIADAYATQYSITLNSNNISQLVGYSDNLNYSLTLNGEISNKPVIWSSSNTDIVIIDQNGVFSILDEGNATINVCMMDNSNICDSIIISGVLSTPSVSTNEIVPKITDLLLNQTQIYNVKNYIDGVETLDTFTIIPSGADNNKYTFIALSGNSFSVKSLGYDDTLLNILCTNNITSETVSINIQLKNYW